MSWHFSQALEAAYSEATCSGGEPSAPSNSTPTHGTFWSPGKTTDVSPRSRSGMTYAPSTADHGEALLTWFRAGFHARTSPAPEKEKVSTESGLDCGGRWLASLEKCGPDSYSWKTRQYSLLGGLESFSETWPRWGMMQNGECWELTTPGHLTEGTGSGLWQTPVADDAVDRMKGKINSRGEPKLSAQVKMWPTPTCNDAKNNGPPSQADRNTPPLNLIVGGALNPDWAEWLMGWPIGWTDLKPLAMARFQQWRRSHGVCSEVTNETH